MSVRTKERRGPEGCSRARCRRGNEGVGRRQRAMLFAASMAALLTTYNARPASAQELMGTRIVSAENLRETTGTEGVIRTYFDAPTSTLLNLGLRVSTLAPGASPHPTRPHARPTESVLLVQTGTLEVQLADSTYVVAAGGAVLLGPNEWHSLRSAGSEPVTYYEFAWTSPGMNGEPEYPEEAVNWRRRRPVE